MGTAVGARRLGVVRPAIRAGDRTTAQDRWDHHWIGVTAAVTALQLEEAAASHPASRERPSVPPATRRLLMAAGIRWWVLQLKDGGRDDLSSTRAQRCRPEAIRPSSNTATNDQNHRTGHSRTGLLYVVENPADQRVRLQRARRVLLRAYGYWLCMNFVQILIGWSHDWLDRRWRVQFRSGRLVK